MKIVTAPLAALLLATFAAPGCASKRPDMRDHDGLPVVDPEPEFEKDRTTDKVSPDLPVVATAEEHVGADKFVAALRASGLADELAAKDQLYTLFVPNDDAFDPALLGDTPAEREKNLRYYVLPGRLMSYELTNMAKAPTASGQELDVLAAGDGSFFAVNQARVLVPNVEATNGVVHVIDSMLLPPDHPLADSLRKKSHGGAIHIDQDILRLCGIDEPAVYFDFDSSKLPKGSQAILAELSECVISGPLAGQALRLEGYTDPRGTREYNKTLSAERARSVQAVLEGDGVPDSQLRIVAHGETEAHTSSPAFWDMDRRVDVVLVEDASQAAPASTKGASKGK
ncbi:MAG: fasciclin domain-containing protein [Nannocystaceae bacterium]